MPKFDCTLTTTCVSDRFITVEAESEAAAYEIAEKECLTFYHEDERQTERVSNIDLVTED